MLFPFSEGQRILSLICSNQSSNRSWRLVGINALIISGLYFPFFSRKPSRQILRTSFVSQAFGAVLVGYGQRTCQSRVCCCFINQDNPKGGYVNFPKEKMRPFRLPAAAGGSSRGRFSDGRACRSPGKMQPDLPPKKLGWSKLTKASRFSRWHSSRMCLSSFAFLLQSHRII